MTGTSVKLVRIWLFIGLIMVFIQILLGGITRLTGSGLSITKWEIVTGTFPPASEERWQEEFDLYKATPQYEKINRGISLKEFKFIYFWEYFHRLWARLMGLVFIIPFVVFLLRGLIRKALLRRLIIVIILAALAASFGWIMVASGLVDRPWVNAYKLTLHLNIGILLFGYLLWTYLHEAAAKAGRHFPSRRLFYLIGGLFVIQLLVGGLMSGMKAGLYFPTWPGMYGQFVPDVIRNLEEWKIIHLYDYDRNSFAPAMVQLIHRVNAYLLILLSVIFYVKVRRSGRTTEIVTPVSGIFLGLLLIQVILGILTVLNCVGRIPLLLGVLHQAGAILVLSTLVYLLYLARSNVAKE